MSTAQEHNRFAPPTSRVDDLAPTEQIFSGRGARFGASILDGLALLAVYSGFAFTIPSASAWSACASCEATDRERRSAVCWACGTSSAGS
jgi:hypothetical protein